MQEKDAKAGLFVAPHHTVANFGRSGKHLTERVAETGTFLNAEVPRRQIKMHVRGVADGRGVAWPMPGGAHAEKIAQRRDLSRGTDTADL